MRRSRSQPKGEPAPCLSQSQPSCHVLVQAAWHYRLRPFVGVQLEKRQRGQPPTVIAHAWKSQHRLHKLYHRIANRKSSQVAVVAVARELVGFMWAVMRDLEIEQAAVLDSAA